MCPFEFRATPMPSPRYKFGGSFRKLGTESYGISGVDAYAPPRARGTPWAKRGPAKSRTTTTQHNSEHLLIETSAKNPLISGSDRSVPKNLRRLPGKFQLNDPDQEAGNY